MENLSIVILSRNEEDNIVRCLTSVKWCNDIVLIDSSEDKTVKLAHKTLHPKQLRIIQNQVTDDFALLRNLGLKVVKHDWVLFLDADEIVSEKLKQEISEKIKINRVNGYFLKRNDYFLGRWLRFGETGDLNLLKLGKKINGTWQRKVHEFWKISGKIDYLQNSLQHFPHPSIAEFIHRVNRWTDLDEQEFYNQTIKSNWWKIIIYPLGKFFRNYIWKQGFRDGMPGLIMAIIMSFHSFLTRAKLFMIQARLASNN